MQRGSSDNPLELGISSLRRFIMKMAFKLININ